jgi:hypothetical protein
MGTHLQLHHLAVPGAAQNERSRFSINFLSLSTRRHYVLIVYVVQSPHFDRHHVPFFKERTWNGPGFKITLTENAVQCPNCNKLQRKILWLNNYYTSVNKWEKKEKVVLDLSRRSFIQKWLWPKGSGMKVLEILWTQKRPKLKKNKCMFLFQVIPDLLERGAHQLVQFLLRFCYLLLWEALGFPEQWAAAINLVYDLSGQSYHTFHPSCSAEDGPIVFAINQN